MGAKGEWMGNGEETEGGWRRRRRRRRRGVEDDERQRRSCRSRFYGYRPTPGGGWRNENYQRSGSKAAWDSGFGKEEELDAQSFVLTTGSSGPSTAVKLSLKAEEERSRQFALHTVEALHLLRPVFETLLIRYILHMSTHSIISKMM
jgi:hypothetical protein